MGVFKKQRVEAMLYQEATLRGIMLSPHSANQPYTNSQAGLSDQISVLLHMSKARGA